MFHFSLRLQRGRLPFDPERNLWTPLQRRSRCLRVTQRGLSGNSLRPVCECETWWEHHGRAGLLPCCCARLFLRGTASKQGRPRGSAWERLRQRLLSVRAHAAPVFGHRGLHRHGHLPDHRHPLLQQPALEGALGHPERKQEEQQEDKLTQRRLEL